MCYLRRPTVSMIENSLLENCFIKRSKETITLYRYFSTDGIISTLKNCNLRFSSPIDFNDPYDNNYPVIKTYDQEELKKNIEKSLQRFLVSIFLTKDFEACNVFEESIKRLIIKENIWFYKIISDFESAVEYFLKCCIDNNSFYFNPKTSIKNSDYICCFTSKYDNILMWWSHYADNHKGGVIRFDLPKDFVDDFIKVKYRDTPSNLDLNKYFFLDETEPNELQNVVLTNLTTKYKDWSYEAEIRGVLFNSKLRNIQNYNKNVRVEGNYAYLPFDKNFVKAIYIGAKSVIQNKKEFLEAYSSIFKNVPVYQAEILRNSFNLKFNEIKIK